MSKEQGALPLPVPDVGAAMGPLKDAMGPLKDAIGPAMEGLKSAFPMLSAASSALSALKPPKQVPEPDMKKFDMVMEEPNLKPILQDKIDVTDVFQPPEEAQENEGPKKKDEKRVDTESNTEKITCKQEGGAENDINTKLKNIIEDKLDCKHVKEIIVNNFERFIDEKVVNNHFHSVDGTRNQLKTLSIFYRHGLSKIVSKIMDDVQINEKIRTFFLDEVMKIVEDVDDEKIFDYLYTFNENMVFDTLNDTKVKEYTDANSNNKDKMLKLLLKLYPTEEFKHLLQNNTEIKDKEKWQNIYDEFQLKEEIQEKENKKEENKLLEKMGIDNMLKIVGIKDAKKELPESITNFITESTDFSEIKGGNKRRSKKNRNAK